MSKLSHSNPDHDGVYEGECHYCGEVLFSGEVNVEAFEICGNLVCPDCACQVFEDNSQFGVGA